jgi:predicted dithiol-disulfide oxidoreductase (DUF899 family)
MQPHAVVSHQEWVAARRAFLAKEKDFTRLRDELSRQRRELPWERVDKAYVFETASGKETLGELFGKHSQLMIYHFMFSPEWDEGCPHCSFWADHYDGMIVHLAHRDVSFVVVSRAPLAKIQSFKQRMGWRFKWVSSRQTDFNYDYGVSFTAQDIRNGTAVYNYVTTDPGPADREGLSAFYKDERGDIVHTYSTYARGIDMLNGTYNLLDLAPKGRDEDELESPQAWVRHHDRYEQ